MDIKMVLNGLQDLVLYSLNIGGKGLVGIDIGSSSIKLAVMEVTDTELNLLEFKKIDLQEGTILEDEILNEEILIEKIKEGISSLKTTNRKACLGLFGPNTFPKRMQLVGDVKTKEDIDDQVSWEIEQYLPFEVEDAMISYSIIGDLEVGGVDLIVGAAKEEIVDRFMRVCDVAGLKIKIVDLNQFAIMNLFERIYQDKIQPTKSWIILDLGSIKTTFMVYNGKSLSFTKDINIGGNIITEEIQRTMGLNRNDAENLKVMGDASGNIPEEVVEVIKESLRKIFTEIKKTLDFYNAVSSGDVLDQIVVTGGCVNIPGLIEGLASLLSVEVSVMDIASAVNFDKSDCDEAMIRYICTQGATALGLAMRSFKL